LRALQNLYSRSLGNFDSERSRHLTTGLVYLKYVLDNQAEETSGVKWSDLVEQAHSPSIGASIDEVAAKVEHSMPSLVGLFPLGYGDKSVNQFHLGQMILQLSAVVLSTSFVGGVDIVGMIHEHLLVRGQLLSNDRSSEDIWQLLKMYVKERRFPST
jgi:hypothetical protein